MKFILTKKDIIFFNQEFDEGNFNNESSLDFSLNYAKKTENWTKALSLLIRAILIDHVFEEGNKRTTLLLIKTYAEYEEYKIHNDKALRLIKEILLKNITNIKRIEEMLKNVIK
jgi:prophage maintenance system killer protein